MLFRPEVWYNRVTKLMLVFCGYIMVGCRFNHNKHSDRQKESGELWWHLIFCMLRSVNDIELIATKRTCSKTLDFIVSEVAR